MDQSKLSDRHQVLMLSLRWGERALPVAWRVEQTDGAIGFSTQKQSLDAVRAWLPADSGVILYADRFYGTPDLIRLCQDRGWDYRLRLGIEPMFSDFKSRGFGIEQTHIQYPDRVARLILVMALALYWAVSTGMWDAAENPLPSEKNPARQPRKVARSKPSWFTRGLRKLMKLLLKAMPLPKLWTDL